jgi:hypothetical protein
MAERNRFREIEPEISPKQCHRPRDSALWPDAGSRRESEVCDLATQSKTLIPDLGVVSGLAGSSFLLIPRCTKTGANTAAIFRYEFNA